MVGRRAKSIHLHLLDNNAGHKTKDEIQRRLEAESQMKVDTDKVKPPTWLSKAAKKEFKYLASEMEKTKLLTNTDVHLLAVYCNAYVEYVECEAIVNKEGLMVEHTNKASETNRVPHPLLTKKKAAFDIMAKVAGEFGFTPGSRARIAIPKKPPKEPTEFEQKFGDV